MVDIGVFLGGGGGGDLISFYIFICFSMKKENFRKSEANLPHAHKHVHTQTHFDHKYQSVTSVSSAAVGQNIDRGRREPFFSPHLSPLKGSWSSRLLQVTASDTQTHCWCLTHDLRARKLCINHCRWLCVVVRQRWHLRLHRGINLFLHHIPFYSYFRIHDGYSRHIHTLLNPKPRH